MLKTPKFVMDKEIAFINAINKELIQGVVGQVVHYYAISKEQTHPHRLYNESIRKSWLAPVMINARVLYENEQVSSTGQGQDSKYRAEVYFHNLELVERDVRPREGDFLEFGQVFFEIVSVTEPQLVFGQANNKIMTKCVCVPSREGQFQGGGESGQWIDNSHPVEQVKYDPK